MATFSRLQVGQVLYDVNSKREYWCVRILELRPATRSAVVSWNTNKPQVYTESHLARLRLSPPKPRRSTFDCAIALAEGGKR